MNQFVLITLVLAFSRAESTGIQTKGRKKSKNGRRRREEEGGGAGWLGDS